MTRPVDLYLYPPKGAVQFESLVRTCAKLRWSSKDFVFNGRPGQRQKGVDVYGEDQKGRLIGVQSKNTPKGIAMTTIRAEIRKAESFRPVLDHYCICTSADTDSPTQEQVRQLSRRRKLQGLFTVQVLFWPDLHDLLCDDDAAVSKHFGIYGLQGLAGPDGRLVKDRERFEELMEALPYDPTVRPFEEHDFHHPFRYDDVKPLSAFLDGWRSRATAFYDETLREEFGTLYKAVSRLYDGLTDRTTFVGRDAKMIGVAPEHLRRHRTEQDVEDAKLLNLRRKGFVAAYDGFIDLCRTTLYS